MNECDEEIFLTVPLKLSAGDIRLLAYEYEQNESSKMTFFIEKILREADKICVKTEQNCMKIINANPFSMQRKNNYTGETL